MEASPSPLFLTTGTFECELNYHVLKKIKNSLLSVKHQIPFETTSLNHLLLMGFFNRQSSARTLYPSIHKNAEFSTQRPSKIPFMELGS